jgi:NADPH:quinone reductase-like Zn-dependent oxidoreductase
VGHLAVQFAKHFGLYVVGTAGARNLSLVRGLGADEAVDYAGGAAALRERYAGSDATKFDILVDLVGGETLEFAIAELLRPGAAVAHVGTPGSDPAANARHRAAAIAGGGAPRWTETIVRPSGTQLAEIAALFAAGRARLNIAQTFPLHKVPPPPILPPPPSHPLVFLRLRH